MNFQKNMAEKKEREKLRRKFSGEWHDLYHERKDICEGEKVHCPSFSIPLMSFEAGFGEEGMFDENGELIDAG